MHESYLEFPEYLETKNSVELNISFEDSLYRKNPSMIPNLANNV